MVALMTTMSPPPNCLLCKHWLKDGGIDDNNEYLVQSIPCQTSFQSRAAHVNSHEQYPAAIGKWLDASKRGCYGLDR
eukprot:858561-Pelagomonas_calceolata.AAC.2